jgi:hypothetical protein
MRGPLKINRAIDDILDSLSQWVDLDKLICRLNYTFDIWMRGVRPPAASRRQLNRFVLATRSINAEDDFKGPVAFLSVDNGLSTGIN